MAVPEPTPFRMPAPMSAVTGELPPDDGLWAFEPKWDGMRCLAGIDHGSLRARSRTDKDLVASFPELETITSICDVAVLDGELVALDEDGRPSFGRLQQRLGVLGERAVQRSAEVAVIYVIFDLLRLGELDVTSLPYEQRRRLLTELVDPGPTWQVSPSHVGDGEAWLAAAREQRIEGIMAKRLASRYQPGRRSADWRKIKIRHAQEFVVCGWTPGTGRRSSALGALILGCHDRSVLRWVGNVGTGFSDADLTWWSRELASSTSTTSPFDEPPRHPALRGANWVEPRHVVQVAYTEWTTDRRLRHPSMLGRRSDVEVDQVRCEE